ncbi:MAG: dihydroxyacetone kinase family protein [Microterricola sp.]
MTYLYNDAADFADELITGFTAANGAWVTAVPGGVVRATTVPEGQVVVITGGGSGHYPAFAGLVGPGLAHGAAMGNVFASPSAQQVYNVAKAAHAGGGVLLTYGNYAGDVLNFNQAQERLIAEGIACRTVAVTDDIFSAAPTERHKRRGIAGDLAVFKAAAAAAEQGLSLDEVWAVANHANERTRTFGVAFSGCYLPGATEPLFTVAPGRMAVGMGIHGEPGIDERDIPSAHELAELLVSRLLEEIPDGVQPDGARVVPIVNGLGAVKYEELFVLYGSVSRLLADAGLQIVEPEVGELVTSFQMAGVSLTLFWLDETLEQAWRAPVDTPAYRKGSLERGEIRSVSEISAAIDVVIPEATDASREVAVTVATAIQAIAETIDTNADALGRMDAIAGDGDHGIGMQRGATAARAAAVNALEAGAGAGTVLRYAGDAWADRAGGTSGALWGLILRALGDTVGDSERPSPADVATGIGAGSREVVAYGKAQLGDKTMVDTLLPFQDALAARTAEGVSLSEAWAFAATVADDAARATADMLPRMGRARPHAEKSLGTPDPGAHSMALIIRAVEAVLSQKKVRP